MLDFPSRVAAIAFVLASALIGLSCAAPEPARPNVLWIVWDTVRADRLGVYGHDADTTPFLDEWVAGARVFDNALSTAGYTLPSHASMFTGLLPSEHCTNNATKQLADEYVTAAELLRDAGYQTFAFSANPHVSPRGNLVQGFDTVYHPWSDEIRTEAIRILNDKLPEDDHSSEFVERFRAFERGEEQLTMWNLKAAGELAGGTFLRWMDTIDSERPYFAFINYMEAHRPYIPPRRYRERLMEPEDVAKSYDVDRSWTSMWEFTFGLRDYDEEALALTRATYDATIAELDEYLRELLGALAQNGHLDDTIVVLTSDHGEHLGEQHMFDHQYSIYQPLLRVPLIVHAPGRFAPGRDSRPVMNYDIFPTLLELAGVEPPAGLESRAVSLLHPVEQRVRFAEEPSSSVLGVKMILEKHPDFDSEPWLRNMRSLIVGSHKLISASDGSRELFDLEHDPWETEDLVHAETEIADSLSAAIERYYASLQLCVPGETVEVELPPEQEALLRSLGYLQ